MPTSFDLSGLRFNAPALLPLLAIPALLLVVWVWQAWRRHGDVTQMRKHRQLPTRHSTERLPVLGDLAFWFCLIVALSAVIVAMARPVAVASLVRSSGIDLVVLQDGSASMRVRDVRSDRWRRSMSFLRTLGESMQWEDDRIALALFATIAAPQVRLTRDPNTFFFFLDHLEDEPPFRIEDDTTWDTNIERGIYWGLRLIDKDAELQANSAGHRQTGRARPAWQRVGLGRTTADTAAVDRTSRGRSCSSPMARPGAARSRNRSSSRRNGGFRSSWSASARRSVA